MRVLGPTFTGPITVTNSCGNNNGNGHSGNSPPTLLSAGRPCGFRLRMAGGCFRRLQAGRQCREHMDHPLRAFQDSHDDAPASLTIRSIAHLRLRRYAVQVAGLAVWLTPPILRNWTPEQVTETPQQASRWRVAYCTGTSIGNTSVGRESVYENTSKSVSCAVALRGDSAHWVCSTTERDSHEQRNGSSDGTGEGLAGSHYPGDLWV